MDGKDETVIISSNYGCAVQFAISGNILYWLDKDLESIASADFDGKQQKTVKLLTISTASQIYVFHDRLMYVNLGKLFQLDIKTNDESILRQIGNRFVPVAISSKPVKTVSKDNITVPCSNHNCEQLCVRTKVNNTITGSCKCVIGYMPKGNRCKRSLENFLIFTTGSKIRTINLNFNQFHSIEMDMTETPKNAVAIDFDRKRNSFIYSDNGRGVIRAVDLYRKNSTVIVSDMVGTVDGLVVDSECGIFYWTDSGTKLISVSSLDRKVTRVLIWKDLLSPRSIALNRKASEIFWTDWGSRATIEKANTDGSNRVVVVKSDLVWPNALTIDTQHDKLVWADAHTKKLEMSNFDGTDRQILSKYLHHPFGLTWFNGFIFLTDWELKTVLKMDPEVKNKLESIDNEILDRPMGISAFGLGTQKGENPCDKIDCVRGLCLPINQYQEGKCICPTGIANENICASSPTEFLLMATKTGIRRISLDTPEQVPVSILSFDQGNIVAIDFHFEKQLIFFTDVDNDKIWRCFFNGSGLQLVHTEIGESTMDGISVDWISNLIFWTDTGKNTISVGSLDGLFVHVILDNNLDEPRAIEVSPSHGIIFWTDWGKQPRIERANQDGSDRTVIIQKDIGWPNGLTIYEDRIYWIDAKSEISKISSSNFDGGNRKKITTTRSGFSLTVLSGKVFWSNYENSIIESIDLDSTKKSAFPERIQFSKLWNIKSISAARQTSGDNTLTYRK